MAKICIPLNIIRNFKLSPRARIVWAELSVLPRNAENHFVVKTKEFSRSIGVCASTTRRALKILLEQNLIKQVGVFERHHKVFQLIGNEPQQKNPGAGGPKPGPKPEPTPPAQPQPEPKPEPTPEPKLELDGDRTDPERENPLVIIGGIKLGRKLNDGDKPRLELGEKLFKLICERYKKEFPLLNGLNGHPLLDMNMFKYLALDNPTETDLRRFYAYMEEMFREFSQSPFVPRENMIMEYLAV